MLQLSHVVILIPARREKNLLVCYGNFSLVYASFLSDCSSVRNASTSFASLSLPWEATRM